MTVLFRDSITARLLAVLLATVFLAGCGAETGEPEISKAVPEVAKNDRLEVEAHFHQGSNRIRYLVTPDYPAVTCSYLTAKTHSTEKGGLEGGFAHKYVGVFRIETSAKEKAGNVEIAHGPFELAFGSTSDGDSFTATVYLETKNSVELAPKSGFTSITVTQGETTIPPDSVLPAGEYTVTLTGKMPQPPAGEPKDDGSEG